MQVTNVNNKISTSSSIDIQKMANEILIVISKRFPNENTLLQEVSSEGNLARCVYTINNKTVFEVTL